MPISTSMRITCDDSGKTYEIVDGRSVGKIPQLWEIELAFRMLRLPECQSSGSPMMVKKLLVERQLLVDANLVPKSSCDQEAPGISWDEILLQLLARVGVLPQESRCNTD